jgi:hypothetical protein
MAEKKAAAKKGVGKKAAPAKSDEMRKAERVEARVRSLEHRFDALISQLGAALTFDYEEPDA